MNGSDASQGRGANREPDAAPAHRCYTDTRLGHRRPGFVRRSFRCRRPDRKWPDLLTRTTTRLLEDLRDPSNASAWTGFDARYRPVLCGFGRSLGLSPDDAAELAQRALVEFALAYRAGKYARGQGRLSSWLIGIARNTAAAMRREGRVAAGSALSGVEDERAEAEHLTRIWERERDAAILVEALAALRASARLEERTLRAFELVAVRGVPPAEAAAQCGMDVETVYVVKNRLTKRLREIVRDLTSAYDEDA